MHTYRKRFANGHLKLPWEEHFAAKVLGTDAKSSLLDTPSWVGFGDYMANAVVDKDPVYTTKKHSLPQAAKRIATSEALRTDDEMLFKSLAMVKFLLLMDLGATSLGDVLAGIAMQHGGDISVMQVLKDAFAKRAPSTVHKRVTSFWRYMKWDQAQGIHDPWNLSEEKLYRYMSHLRNSKAAATAGQAFLGAVVFMHEHVTIKSFNRVNLSTRVRGVEHELLLKKRPLLQARSLYVDEVKALERFVITPTEEHLGIMAGYFMWCLATSSRFSDSMGATDFEVDVGSRTVVISAGTYRHKTSTTAMHKTTLLPLMGIGRWFSEHIWAERWLDRMVRLFGPLDKRPFLLPAFSEKAMKWLDRPMSSAEGTLWLRDVMTCAGCGIYAASLTTHCLKVTRLAWFTSSGNPSFSLQERRIAGHHLDREHRSALTYGRDNHLGVLRKEALLLHRIATNQFDPDESRSHQIDRELELVLQEHVDAEEAEDSDFETLDDVRDGADIAEDADEFNHRETQESLDPNVEYMQHHLSGTLHIVRNPLKFCCGRDSNPNYSEVDGSDVMKWQVCSQCVRVRYGST